MFVVHKMLCSLELLRDVFEGKLGRRAVVEVLGGCESDGRGVSDPAGRLLYYNCF